ncbi:uncharacterized protein CLUP02_06651 [Colletotrichum lupini]|uniref:Uncharacterized protein n=1 Tax=Colletotrichum lupini TaxID=145971 RepID=A0A9Q8SPT4_9PEZI|nr:uncharacterized protein CLUP02_06651 [Colletotrichum lupini]UQC81165.1 hypothetical protein CLUP02_06651 [Colletotrichum lupini]
MQLRNDYLSSQHLQNGVPNQLRLNKILDQHHSISVGLLATLFCTNNDRYLGQALEAAAVAFIAHNPALLVWALFVGLGKDRSQSRLDIAIAAVHSAFFHGATATPELCIELCLRAGPHILPRFRPLEFSMYVFERLEHAVSTDLSKPGARSGFNWVSSRFKGGSSVSGPQPNITFGGSARKRKRPFIGTRPARTNAARAAKELPKLSGLPELSRTHGLFPSPRKRPAWAVLGAMAAHEPRIPYAGGRAAKLSLASDFAVSPLLSSPPAAVERVVGGAGTWTRTLGKDILLPLQILGPTTKLASPPQLCRLCTKCNEGDTNKGAAMSLTDRGYNEELFDVEGEESSHSLRLFFPPPHLAQLPPSTLSGDNRGTLIGPFRAHRMILHRVQVSGHARKKESLKLQTSPS